MGGAVSAEAGDLPGLASEDVPFVQSCLDRMPLLNRVGRTRAVYDGALVAFVHATTGCWLNVQESTALGTAAAKPAPSVAAHAVGSHKEASLFRIQYTQTVASTQGSNAEEAGAAAEAASFQLWFLGSVSNPQHRNVSVGVEQGHFVVGSTSSSTMFQWILEPKHMFVEGLAVACVDQTPSGQSRVPLRLKSASPSSSSSSSSLTWVFDARNYDPEGNDRLLALVVVEAAAANHDISNSPGASVTYTSNSEDVREHVHEQQQQQGQQQPPFQLQQQQYPPPLTYEANEANEASRDSRHDDGTPSRRTSRARPSTKPRHRQHRHRVYSPPPLPQQQQQQPYQQQQRPQQQQMYAPTNEAPPAHRQSSHLHLQSEEQEATTEVENPFQTATVPPPPLSPPSSRPPPPPLARLVQQAATVEATHGIPPPPPQPSAVVSAPQSQVAEQVPAFAPPPTTAPAPATTVSVSAQPQELATQPTQSVAASAPVVEEDVAVPGGKATDVRVFRKWWMYVVFTIVVCFVTFGLCSLYTRYGKRDAQAIEEEAKAEAKDKAETLNQGSPTATEATATAALAPAPSTSAPIAPVLSLK